MTPAAATLIAVIVQTIVLVGVGWQLWRVGKSQKQTSETQQQVAAVLGQLLTEAQASATERESRRQAEAAGAWYDAETVRSARLLVAAMETLPACQPCRDELERIIDRRKLWPRQAVDLSMRRGPIQDARGM